MLTDEEIAKMKNCLPFALDPTLPNEAKLQMVQIFDDLQTARRDLRVVVQFQFNNPIISSNSHT